MRLPVFLAFTVVIIPFNVVDDDEGDGCISTSVVLLSLLLLLLTLVHGFDPSMLLMTMRVLGVFQQPLWFSCTSKL